MMEAYTISNTIGLNYSTNRTQPCMTRVMEWDGYKCAEILRLIDTTQLITHCYSHDHIENHQLSMVIINYIR